MLLPGPLHLAIETLDLQAQVFLLFLLDLDQAFHGSVGGPFELDFVVIWAV